MSKRELQRNQEVTSYAAALELENRGQALLTRGRDMPRRWPHSRRSVRPGSPGVVGRDDPASDAGGIDPGYGPGDDLRHRPEPGGRMRDSLFWELIMPEEQLGMQIYLYPTDRGKTGYNVCVWGPGDEPLVLDLKSGTVPDDMDLDDFEFEGLTLTQPDLLRTCSVRYRGENVSIDYDFEAIHDAFSYRQNPDGLLAWFAQNRLEQTGHVTGFFEIGDRRIEWDRKGHRDHSWGLRNWGVPHHWKWIVAYTESGRAVNGWIWITEGEWGFGG